MKIPSFIGNIDIYIRGPQTMTNLVNLLISFAKFSGIGIKTSIGMGGIWDNE